MTDLEIALEYLDDAKGYIEMELSTNGDLDGHLVRSVNELTKLVETLDCVNKEQNGNVEPEIK